MCRTLLVAALLITLFLFLPLGAASDPTADAASAPDPQQAGGAPSDPPGFPRRVLDRKVDLLGGPVRGRAEAPITIVEFADFQCSFSIKEYPKLRQIMQEYPGHVRLVFKHLPCMQHELARPAAAAAVLAYRQLGNDGFWRMHDLILESPQRLSLLTLREYAMQLGMDLVQFDRVTRDPVLIDALLARDVAEAELCRVSTTPTVFINGAVLSGWRSIEDYRAQINRILQVSAPEDVQILRSDPDRCAAQQNNVPILGPPEAPVWIMVFGDMLSPSTRQEHTIVRQLMETYPERVRLVFKHCPAPDQPASRLAAALTLLAYREKGNASHWLMYELIMEAPLPLSAADLRRIACEVGVAPARVDQVMGDPELIDGLLAMDAAEQALSCPIREIPTVFIRGKLLQPHTLQDYEARIRPILDDFDKRDGRRIAW